MSENSYWSGGRPGPAGAAYSDEDDVRAQAEHGYQSGYGQSGGHEAGGYGEPGYEGSGRHGTGSWPGDAGGHGNAGPGYSSHDSGYGHGGYGGTEGYGNAGSGYSPYDSGYGSSYEGGYGGYAEQNRYGADYGAEPGYGSGHDYGAGQGYGAASGYGQDHQSGPGYGTGPDYGQGSGYSGPGYGSGQDYGSGYGAGAGYEQDSGYTGDRYGADQAGYGDTGYGTSGYGAADYGASGYGSAGNGYPDHGYPSNGYSDSGYADSGYADHGYTRDGYPGQNYSWPGEYGAPGSQRPALGPGTVNDDAGSFSETNDRADSGSEWAYRQESGSLSSGDYEPRRRRGASPRDRDDSGAFRGPGSESAAEDGGYERAGALGSSLEDTGSIRWSAGPPSAKPRAERDLEDPLPGPAAAEPDGYAGWHNEPADDWRDEADGSLLSRRFGRGGGDEPPDYGPPARVKGKKRRTGRGKAAFWLAIAIVLVVVGGAADVGYGYVHGFINNRYGNYAGNGYGTVLITVPPGASLNGLGPVLQQKGVILALRPYDSAAAAAQNASSLQPGVYKLHHHMNAALAVKLLLSGNSLTTLKFQVRDGERASDIVTRLAAFTHLPAKQFTHLIDHPSQLGLPSWAPAGITAEGFLYPDTYNFQPHESALKILQQMVADFKQRTTSLAAAAQKVFTTPWHALIVASLIQAEAGNIPDMAKISRVIWNRLKLGMPLEFDSTVFYAMHKYGTAITKAQEHFPSPYNTYLHTGLPPGPIESPNIHALFAAVHPVKANYLYFITDTRKKPYTTHFTNSLSQLQQWQQTFQG